MTDLRDELTADILANEVRMLRASFAGTILLLEGESDAIVFKSLIDCELCETIIGHGKQKVVLVVSMVEGQVPGVLGIVDADFDRLNGINAESANVLTIDHHDLETMLFASSALEKVLLARASSAKIAQFESLRGISIRDAILREAKIVGMLRWVSLRNELGLDFDGLGFSNLLNDIDLSVNVQKLVEVTAQRSHRQHMTVEVLTLVTTELSVSRHSPWELVCGHDLVEILALGLRKTFGALKQVENSAREVARSLALAYERSHFHSSQLYQQIKAWEGRNIPFKVLSPLNG